MTSAMYLWQQQRVRSPRWNREDRTPPLHEMLEDRTCCFLNRGRRKEEAGDNCDQCRSVKTRRGGRRVGRSLLVAASSRASAWDPSFHALMYPCTPRYPVLPPICRFDLLQNWKKMSFRDPLFFVVISWLFLSRPECLGQEVAARKPVT